MSILYEVLPVLLFFLAFKFYDIYVATIVGIITTIFQVVASRLYKGTWNKKELITCIVFIIFGGMTLYFHNPIFVKWKPTIVFWIFASIIFITQFFTHKPLMQRLMENMIQTKGFIPSLIWRRLNIIWGGFFIMLGGINLYIAYFMSNSAWVNFKFYGITGAFFIFSIIQAFYLGRYMHDDNGSAL